MPETKCGFETIPGGASGSDLLVAYGPTLKVDIGFDPAYSHKNIGQIPIPGLRGISALVDTGATESCIDSRLASQLNLPIVDRRQISGLTCARHVPSWLPARRKRPKRAWKGRSFAVLSPIIVAI